MKGNVGETYVLRIFSDVHSSAKFFLVTEKRNILFFAEKV